MNDVPGKGGQPHPPLGLSREAVGYLVVSAGVATAVMVLFLVPETVPYHGVSRVGAALVVVVATAYLNRYVTGEWYDRYTQRPEEGVEDS